MHPLVQHLRSRQEHWLLLVVLAFVTAVYFPVTRVFFHEDDFVHLSEIADRGFWFFLVRPWAGHLYLARNTFFYLPYWLFGFRPEPYAWTALALQLVNTALLFRVARNLTGSAPLATLAAALWGTCLLHSGALGWFSGHGLVFAGTALLFVLERLTAYADRGTISPRAAVLCAFVLWVGATCSGVGTGVAIASPLVIALLVPAAYRDRHARIAFLAVPVVVVATYVAVPKIYSYFFGPLPLISRLMTTTAFSDQWPVLKMLGELMKMGIVGTVWGLSFVPDKGPATPAWGTLGAYLLAVGGAFIAADGVARRRMLGLIVLAGAAYGIIALGRANMFGLDAVTQAAKAGRYHYVATIPIALLLVVSVAQVARFTRLPTTVPRATLAAWAAVAVYFFVKKTWRLDEHKPCRELVASTLKNIDARIDAQPLATDVLFENAPLANCAWGVNTSDLFVIAYPQNEVHGRHVYFSTANRVELRRYGSPEHRRLSPLLVAPPGTLPELPDPRAATVSTASAACGQAKVIYERNRVKLGCPGDDWRSWENKCEQFFPGPSCSEEVAAMLSCLEANEPANFRCDEDGMLALRNNACWDKLGALISCGSW